MFGSDFPHDLSEVVLDMTAKVTVDSQYLVDLLADNAKAPYSFEGLIEHLNEGCDKLDDPSYKLVSSYGHKIGDTKPPLTLRRTLETTEFTLTVEATRVTNLQTSEAQDITATDAALAVLFEHAYDHLTDPLGEKAAAAKGEVDAILKELGGIFGITPEALDLMQDRSQYDIPKGGRTSFTKSFLDKLSSARSDSEPPTGLYL